MKKIVCLLALVVVAASAAHGQGAVGAIAKQRAKEAVRESNVRQGIGAPAPQIPPVGQSGRALPANPVAKVKADLRTIVDSAALADETRKQFAADVLACARGSHKPAAVSVEKFANGVSTALAGKGIQPSVQSRLADDINLMVNSASLSAQRTAEVADDVQAILQTAGLNCAQAVSLSAELKAVAAELQAGR